MLDALTIPPRLIVRALDDLHTLAEGLRRLTEHEGDLQDLLASVRVLPDVEDQLSQRIDSLETQVSKLNEWLQPLHTELTDLDATAEALQKALAGVQETIRAFHEELRELRDRIPGI
jgi:chromosome segregation ATPase